jgi:hypothetical protein
METLAMIREVFWKDNMSRTRVLEGKVQTHWNGKIDTTGEEQAVKRMPIIFYDMNRFVHKVFILAGQTVNSAC